MTLKNRLEKFLNFEQAVNKLKKSAKAAPEEIKKEAKKQPASLALPDDRRRYLKYCISLLDTVDSDLTRRMPENIKVKYSNKDFALMFKTFLLCHVEGASIKSIAKHFHISSTLVEDILFLAQIAVKRAIEKKRKYGIPLVGER